MHIILYSNRFNFISNNIKLPFIRLMNDFDVL